MRPDDLARRHPRLWHMAEAGSWDRIREQGLLTTAQLVERYPPEEAERAAIVDHLRTRSHHLDGGRVVVRDNLPLDAGRLRAALVDMTVAEWLHGLNTRVFFWVDERRLEGLLRAYPDRDHDVLVLDTRELLDRHADRVELTTMNTGATSRFPNRPCRGRDTFMTIADFPHGERRSTGSTRTKVVELAVPDGVPDVADLVDRVERRRAGGPGRVFWRRPQAPATTSR